MTTSKPRKAARREVRLSERDDALLVEAAGLVGTSVSEFVIEHAVSDAEAIVHAHHTIELDEDHHRRFVAALQASGPNARFTEAVRSAHRLKHAGRLKHA